VRIFSLNHFLALSVSPASRAVRILDRLSPKVISLSTHIPVLESHSVVSAEEKASCTAVTLSVKNHNILSQIYPHAHENVSLLVISCHIVTSIVANSFLPIYG